MNPFKEDDLYHGNYCSLHCINKTKLLMHHIYSIQHSINEGNIIGEEFTNE